MDVYREIYENNIKNSEDLPEYGNPLIKFINPELFRISGGKMSPKDLLELKNKIDRLLDGLSYDLYQVVFFDIPLNETQSEFHKYTPEYVHYEEVDYHQINGDFSFLFDDAVTEGGLMASNNIVAERLKTEFQKVDPNNTINFDSECSCCYFESKNEEEIIRFRDWLYDTYISPYVTRLKDELQIYGFYTGKNGHIVFDCFFKK